VYKAFDITEQIHNSIPKACSYVGKIECFLLVLQDSSPIQFCEHKRVRIIGYFEAKQYIDPRLKFLWK
jgi:hypothetical protein